MVIALKHQIPNQLCEWEKKWLINCLVIWKCCDNRMHRVVTRFYDNWILIFMIIWLSGFSHLHLKRSYSFWKEINAFQMCLSRKSPIFNWSKLCVRMCMCLCANVCVGGWVWACVYVLGLVNYIFLRVPAVTFSLGIYGFGINFHMKILFSSRLLTVITVSALFLINGTWEHQSYICIHPWTLFD